MEPWPRMPRGSLLACAGAFLVLSAPLHAREPSRALVACGEASREEAHRRRCWRHSNADRETVREYDRADSLRDWEKPRDYE